MTRDRAKEILRSVWGTAGNLSQQQAEEIGPQMQAHETVLDCLQRIAGDHNYDWRLAGAFSREAQAHFANLR